MMIVGAFALGEMLNPNSLLLVKFCGSNHLIKRGFVGEISETKLVHVMKSRQTAVSIHRRFSVS
jgi:hypothetical protein